MSEPVVTTPPPPAPKTGLPAGVASSRYWKETPDGPLIKHDHERPVDDASDCPVGVWWMCPDPDCKTGEWVFPQRDTGEPGWPKKPFCSGHGTQLLPGRAEATADDPKLAARVWLQQRMAEKAAAARKAAADAASARIAAIRQAGREEAAQLGSDLREHAPSGAISLAALITDYALLEKMPALQTYVLGTGLAVGGTVLAYLAVYAGELVYARRMGYTIKELPRAVRDRAQSHARWIASGVLASGAWLLIGETVGADLNNLRGILMSLFGAVLVGVVNYRPWAQMVARRKAEARARLAAAEAAARAEEERLAAEEAERQRRKQAAEDARLAAEEAAVTEAKKIVTAEDDRITAGRKFAERWEQLAAEAKTRLTGPGFEIWRTAVMVEETRKLTTRSGGTDVVIGWEFLVKAELGVLTPRTGDVSPFVLMRRWLADMLEVDVSRVDLTYHPTRLSEDAAPDTKPEQMINCGLVTLSESFPLGAPVRHPLLDPGSGDKPVYVDSNGGMWGFIGRDLRGRAVYRLMWAPGQAGGCGRYGVTGTGKSVCTQVTAINDLLLGIFPIIHDAGKNAMDFADFYGIFPVGHTIEHRDVIRASLWAEMKRRQAWINKRTTTGLYGMEVVADPTWNPKEGGAPIRCTWEEFHMHMKDQAFVSLATSGVRLQRATAIMMELATQGGGLADTGDSNLRDQVNEICRQMMRMTDHQANMTGYRGSPKPSELPNHPGMMVMQEGSKEPVALRSAFFPRDPQDPNSLIYQLRRPSATNPLGDPILQAPRLHPETIEVFKEHGLWDLWELGKTKSGREQLQSEADPVESTAFPPGLAAVLGQPAALAAKPRMRADEVVLALLKHESDASRPGLTQPEMLASPWWGRVDGEWARTPNGVPAHTTVSRACTRLATVTDQQVAAGAEPMIVSDSSVTPARWGLLPAGAERAEQSLTVLRAAGVLGGQAKAQAQAGGVDVAALERQAMLQAEQAALIQELVREAAGLTGVP